MPLLVDTYNVLHVTGVLHPERAGIDVGGLAELIAASRFANETVWLVCDGVARGETSRPRGRIVVVHSGPRRSADDHIGRMIDTSSAPRRLTVVSSDLRIGRMARRRRCRWLRSEEFLERIDADAGRANSGSQRRRGDGRVIGGAPLPGAEIERWMRRFGVDESMASIAAASAASAPPRIERRADENPGDGPATEPGAALRAATQAGSAIDSDSASQSSGAGLRPASTIDWASLDLRELDVESLSAIDFSAIMEAAMADHPPVRRGGHRKRKRRP